MSDRKRPLAGLRVIEMGSLLAGPFCGQLFGDFGAEVIKVEPPGKGDPMRVRGRHRGSLRGDGGSGSTFWWPVIARNKKCLGPHDDEVFGGLLGIPAEEIEAMKERGAI